ncbi:hypothetical protein G5B38_17080 [Pseudohalocynthiibacter aestuariivivens]|nr:hypothetical protein G5B38_17080 [Pseudohalocynthiibacter aestuariivivens]
MAFLAASPAAADGPTLYPYATNVNYCPAGLQPIVLNGVICCGQPTTSVSYQQVMKHPRRAKKRHYSARTHCPVGTKGCS